MARLMKDSGIPWIGEIPVDWELKRLKNILAERKEKNDPQKTDFILSLGLAYGVVPYSEKEGGGNKAKEVVTDYRLAYPGDIVMNSMNIISGSVGLSRYFGCVSPVYYMLYPHNPDNRAKYYCYLFQTNAFQRSLLGLGNGILIKESATGNYNTVRMRIPMEKLGIQLLPIPSPEEQQRIANFLDAECVRIDAIIEQTRATVEEYKKLKQSIITQAVTKGIRPNRPMKDSGIEWIGDIPEEWDILPFRRVLQERNEKNSPVKSTERLSLSIDLGVTLYAEKTTNLDRFKDDFEQYKIAHVGDLVMNSMNMIVGATGVSNFYGCVSPAYYTFFDNEKDHVATKYCEYIFRSKAMLRVLFSLGKGIYAIVRGDDRVNTCRLKVSRDDLRSLQIPQPSTDEQREIVSYLNEKCAKIDKLIEDKELFINEIESYKKSLIYEYVTGKKEAC